MCTTVIIGKAASASGRILIAHNEDNGGRIIAAQNWVPAADYPAGEMIRFEANAAQIPQVAHTYGFYWSQTISPTGASFSDGFVNEKGVVICSNACIGIFEENVQPLKADGIGYGIRRLMAERAATAREAVNVAIDLLTTYGYFSEGRTYTVADNNEAWQIAVHQGNCWVARRVQDDEIVFIPNNFMMNDVDVTDTENVIVAPGVVDRAVKTGRSPEAADGCYPHFNFRAAYAPVERRTIEFNYSRNQIGWKALAGLDITDSEAIPYSVKTTKKFTPEDLKAVMRLHKADIGSDNGWYHCMSNGICRATTHESVVWELNPNPLLIRGWRAYSRPCESVYVPFYPLARPAEATARFDSPAEATALHFAPGAKGLNYNPDWAPTVFVDLANTLDFQWQDRADFEADAAEQEAGWAKDEDTVYHRAESLLKVSRAKAEAYLHAYNVHCFEDACALARNWLYAVTTCRMAILADEVQQESDKTVDIVLYGSDTFDVSTVDVASTFGGVGRAVIPNKLTMAETCTHPIAHRVEDVDGDGHADLVLTFRQADLAKNAVAGTFFDFWVYTFAEGVRVAASDAVNVKAAAQ